ncbi:MarR family transcriptional regulator [Sulfitobacter sp. R18_1]|uniref:GbsR/MarR family transcriptional regulator n=1 Tax=Sulfitobacter sp. R18_1 TaxID=2821104 RepID=UPI001AD95D00|nr:MarR family transcriptional regulator [Sulfitobacter sp. R18_1]MBO9428261.1 MarR family transcriptional regulator [Sulfitobacter sp. R18_1]
MNTGNECNVRTDFIEKIGLITQAEGLPRIAGRVFGMLVFDGEMVSFGEISERLQVSRASVSTSIRLLEERGMIKRVAKPGDRQDFFQLANNPYENMLKLVRSRARTTKEDIAETIAKLPDGAEQIERLAEFFEFYDNIEFALGVALACNAEADEPLRGSHTNDQ